MQIFNLVLASVYYLAGFYLLPTKKYPLLIWLYSQALALNPKLARAFYLRGQIYHRLVDFSAAMADRSKPGCLASSRLVHAGTAWL